VGLIVIDAGVLIGFFDATDVYHEVARDVLEEARSQGDSVLLPASALAECMVEPARRGDEAIDTVLEFVDRYPLEIVALDEMIAETAARLRAKHGGRLRLPDALVVATAVALGADRLVTTDRRWPSALALGLRGDLVLL